MSTPIVAIANFAGGVGKSTLAHALAVACAEYGKKSLLIDLDGNGALTFKLGLERSRENIVTCVERFDFRPHTANGSISELIAAIPEKFDLVIVDTPTYFSNEVDQIFQAARLILMPIRESLHSLRGALSVMKVTSAPCKALPLFRVGSSELANLISAELDLLDGEISIAAEVIEAEPKTVSVLTSSKNCEVAQQYRDCAYSLLEELNIF
jgi:chromosome partitioning protein